MHDNNGRFLILDATINGSDYLLINFYNANTEREQLTTIKNLNNLLKDFEDFYDKKVIFAGDFNLIFDRNLESAGGNPLLKKHSFSEIIKLNENLNLCDIWRVRNPHKKLFTFRQKHFTGIIQRRLDYIFVSNVLQESVKKAEILNALSSDNYPVFCSFVNNDIFARGSGVWKFNNSLLLNTEFVKKLKTHIKTVTSNFQENSYFSDHSKWKFLKYEIRKFSISFSKNFAKKQRIIQTNLENRIKILEQSLKNEEDFNAYNLCKLELENIYDKKAEGAKLRSKCKWYQHGEKPTKFFLNLEKQKAINTTVRHLIDDGKDITDLKEINACICKFYKNLFKKNVSKLDSEKKSFLDSIALPNLTSKSFDICESGITEKDLIIALKSMPYGKSPGHDGLTKEFYEHFWDDLKFFFINSLKQSKIEGNLSISQRQAVIKLIVKKDRGKRFVKNWRPISLLNVDTKILSKSLAEKLKSALPELISSNQTAYVQNRCISESGRLISDVIEMCDILDIPGYLVTMDIEKAFDSLDHDFLLFVLKKFGFGENFIHWIKVLLNKQQSCVINGGFTTQYFNLEKGARQGDPISVYLFILALEVLFELIKNNDDIRGITIFNHTFLYTSFADDSTFFVNDLLSVKNLVDTFKVFSLFSGLNANFSKCEITGLGSLKGVLEAVCGLKSINLTTDTIKILGVHFSYNSTLKVQNNFLDTVKSIQQALRFWNRRILSLEGKIIIFKTLLFLKLFTLLF